LPGIRAADLASTLSYNKAFVTDALVDSGRMMPTAIIWGWNDTFAPYRFGLAAMDIIRKANDRTEMHFVNHSGHFVFAEQPVEVTRLINSFIKAHS
jgi:pimeloyl-ACP methyl ester carboxylesterase